LEFLDASGHPGGLSAIVTAKSAEGLCQLRFEGVSDLHRELDRVGETPLPPYIRRDATGPLPADRERYQTVFAETPGSVAAPTAGLHFSEALLRRLVNRGITWCTVTLHVGLGTFATVKTSRIEDHRLHSERYSVSPQTAAALNDARRDRRRIVAVGTTTVRVLEHVAAQHDSTFIAGAGNTSIFLRPPAMFRVVDALITNFHLPKSTLLMLVCAFAAPNSLAGRELILRAYAAAVQQRYRFYSYGDAMLIQ
jgi:S-adenosylmethionine:tRNA ribosyltransferase-isomerase